jgi:TolB-like protein
MFTDIVGYTALMGADEERAFEILRASREIQKTAVQKNGGKWLKEMGDGVLAQFDSALKAVQCSIEIQIGAQKTFDQKIRIGIHLGDVTVEGGDVFGDGVNIASRLQSLADPGGIYVSESVQHAISARPDIQFKFLADVNLKNVQHGIKTYYVTGHGLPLPSTHKIKGLTQPTRKRYQLVFPYVIALLIIIVAVGYSTRSWWLTTTNETHRLVVLPVEDRSRNENGKFMVEGILSDLITQIGQLGALQVISKTSSIGYKGANKTLTQIANELHVDLAMESDLVRIDDTVQLQVRLIQTLPEEKQIWGKTYKQAGKGIMQIYDDIALDIAEAIHLDVSTEERSLLTLKRDVNPDAYREFLKSQHYIANFTRNDFELAEKSLRLALQYDPDFLNAHVGLVWLWIVELQMGIVPREEAYPKIKAGEAKVLSYNIENENVLRMEASIHSYVEWQWEKGTREIERALVLNPNNAASHQSYGYTLAIIGYHDLAEKEMDLASELNPFDPFIESFYGWDYLYARQYEKAN